MLKYVILFIIWVIVSVIVVMTTGGISTDNVTVPQMSCDSKEVIKEPALVFKGEGYIRNLAYANNVGTLVSTTSICDEDTIYKQAIVFDSASVSDRKERQVRVNNPNPWRGHFLRVYNVYGKEIDCLEEGFYCHIYEYDKKELIFSVNPIVIENGQVKFVTE